MVARNLIDALRRGEEGEIRWELDLFSRTPRWSHELRAVSREEAFRLLARGGTATQVALSEHPDGRVREAALLALAPDPSASLPSLLRRAVDWVPAIRLQAVERAISGLRLADDATLLQTLPLVFALTRKDRAVQGELVSTYQDEVAQRAGLARRIRRAYRNGPVGRWASWRILGRDETLDGMAKESLHRGQPSVQLKAARQMIGEPGAASDLMSSRNPQVRRLALDHLNPEELEAALIDPHARVRNDARFLLGKRDFATHYRALLPSPGAVSGLGEMGSREDAEALRPLLHDPAADVRARAVEALVRLLGDSGEADLREALNDPRRRVQKAAVEMLLRLNVGLDAEEVLDMPLPASSRLRLLHKTARWPALVGVLRRARDLAGAEVWLDQWVRQSRAGRTAPKPEELLAARAAFEAAVGALTSRVEQELRRVLRG